MNHINRKENYTTEKVNQKEEYVLKFSQEKVKMARKAKNKTSPFPEKCDHHEIVTLLFLFRK